MGFDTAGFTTGFSSVVVAFFIAWAFGLVVKMLNVGCD